MGKLAAAMTHHHPPRHGLAAAIALAGFLLVGSWLREYEQDDAHVRRLLELAPDGHFREMARVVDASGAVKQHAHAGEWTFDGTNLKRRYTSFDGRQPAAPTMPYATFSRRFESNREFVGTGNVRKREVRYRRVDEGTVP